MQTPLDKAIEAAGSASELSRRMGFPFPSTVSNWRRSPDGKVPLEHCPAIEAATGVRCDELRDDVEWLRDDAGQITGYVVKIPPDQRKAS